ncbi:MAG: LuxR C-terminal-related transcriptional regulator [Paracoccaceae bacterium]
MLIETKLRVPAAGAGVVMRPELIRQIDVIRERKLAIVAAPTGFGKSTLLTQWAGSQIAEGAAVGWLSADSQDNEIGRFLLYLVAALHRADPALGADLPGLIGSSPTLPIDTVLLTLVNELNSARTETFLVIDDFHHLTAPEITRFLEGLLAYAPERFHLVLGSRAHVGLQLAGLRARGQLVMLDETQLRFSLEQTESYMNDRQTLALSKSDILTLHHRTEGWVAGLHLASLSLRDAADKAGFLNRFSGASGDIADFLVQEVLSRLPADLLDFLYCTAILERFSAPLADAVSGSRNAAERIRQIELANLFLIPLDQDRVWFRYHALFADLLRGLLQRENPERLSRLHLRAAQWLSGAGLTADAVQHALAAGDGDMAAGLVETCCMPLIRDSNLTQVRDWLRRLPDEIIAGRPRLQLAQVWIDFHSSQPHAGARILRKVRDELNRRAEVGSLTARETKEFAADLLVLTAGIASAADHSRIGAKIAERALREVPANLGFLRGVSGNVLGFCHYSLGQLEPGRLACLRAREDHLAGQSTFGVLYSDLILGLIDKAAGDLDSALAHLSRATELARATSGTGSYSAAMVGIFEAEILYERDDLVAAEQLLVQHRPLIEECGLVVHDMSCKLLAARLAAARGGYDQALAALESAEKQGQRNHYRRLFAGALHERIKLLLTRNEVRYARMILTSRDISESSLAADRFTGPASELERLAMARVLIAEDRPDSALPLLGALALRQKEDGRLRRYAQVRTVAAIAAFRAGNQQSCLDAISEAVALSMKGGAVLTLADESEALREVLSFARTRLPAWRDLTTPVGQFIAHLMQRKDGSGLPMADKVTPPPFPELSPREVDIARLLGDGLANREISESLAIAPDTVKWHLKNIFGKLGADNRTQAVLRLQEIGGPSPTRTGGA